MPLSPLTYVQHSFDWLFMRYHHSKVVYQIFNEKMVHGLEMARAANSPGFGPSAKSFEKVR